MRLFSGKIFDLDETNDFEIKDIAHALSLVCRFGGHCNCFYSVAEHSVKVAQLIGKDFEFLNTLKCHYPRRVRMRVKRLALLHDAAEAYLGDMVRPLRGRFDYFVRVERQLRIKILHYFSFENLDESEWEKVKHYDDLLLIKEMHVLMNDWGEKTLPPVMNDIKIDCWDSIEAEQRFLEAWDDFQYQDDNSI